MKQKMGAGKQLYIQKSGRNIVNFSGGYRTQLHGGCLAGRVFDFLLHLLRNHHSVSSSCWKNYGSQEADHYYLSWACPKVKAFWCKIYTKWVPIFGTKIIFKWDELLLTSTNMKTKDLLLLERNYKEMPDAPSIEYCYYIIYEIFVMEVITFSMRLQEQKFDFFC